jgi:hypothetical protein
VTAIRFPSGLSGRPSNESAPGSPMADAIRSEMLSLRVRVRSLAERRARTAAEDFSGELKALARESARAMAAACEDPAVLARVRHRLDRQVAADLLRAREDNEDSIDARARALLVTSLDARLALRLADSPRGTSRFAHADLTPGAARATHLVDQFRETIRVRFRALKSRVQSELADLALEMAGETAARLCLRHGHQGREWLWSRLSQIVDQFVAVTTPASLPGALELLATRSVLSGLLPGGPRAVLR